MVYIKFFIFSSKAKIYHMIKILRQAVNIYFSNNTAPCKNWQYLRQGFDWILLE